MNCSCESCHPKGWTSFSLKCMCIMFSVPESIMTLSWPLKWQLPGPMSLEPRSWTWGWRTPDAVSYVCSQSMTLLSLYRCWFRLALCVYKNGGGYICTLFGSIKSSKYTMKNTKLLRYIISENIGFVWFYKKRQKNGVNKASIVFIYLAHVL